MHSLNLHLIEGTLTLAMIYSTCGRQINNIVIQNLKSMRLVLLLTHMGPEPQNSFKEVARAPEYGKITTRHHTFDLRTHSP